MGYHASVAGLGVLRDDLCLATDEIDCLAYLEGLGGWMYRIEVDEDVYRHQLAGEEGLRAAARLHGVEFDYPYEAADSLVVQEALLAAGYVGVEYLDSSHTAATHHTVRLFGAPACVRIVGRRPVVGEVEDFREGVGWEAVA